MELKIFSHEKHHKTQAQTPQPVLASRCGHLTEVGHQGRPVADAQGTRVHGLPARAGREGEVGGDPGDGGDETRNALNFHVKQLALCENEFLTSIVLIDQDWSVISLAITKYYIKVVALPHFVSKPAGAKQLAAQPTGELAGHLRPS